MLGRGMRGVSRVGSRMPARMASAYAPIVGNSEIDATIVPELSRTVWDPGIPEGVPPDDANASTRQDGVGPASQYGSTISAGASAATIQAALDAAGAVATKTSRRFVLLGAGTFTLGSTLSVPSYVILRGTSTGVGNRQTILRRSFDGTSVSLGGGVGTWGTVRNVSGVAYRGATQITVDNAADFSVGDILAIDQISDGSYAGAGVNPTLVYNEASNGDWLWWVSSLWYCRQNYANEHLGVGSYWGRFPNATDYRHSMELVEVLSKSGNTLTIWNGTRGRGKPLHMTYYNSPQIYRSAGASGDVLRYAGLENIKLEPTGTNGQRNITMEKAAYCWIKNVELDGDSAAGSWAGVHLQVYSHAYRCEVRECYVHESGNYNQNQNAYGIVVAGTNNLFENNVVRWLNKPFNIENSGGGNAIAYNFVDGAVIGSRDGWQEAHIGSHAAFCHHELIEGNYTTNMGFDSTHGNNGFNTMFRNWARGVSHTRPVGGSDSGFMRCVFSDGWNMHLNSIGNVLSYSGSGVDNLFTAATVPADAGNTSGVGYQGIVSSAIYLIGANAWNTADNYPVSGRVAGDKPGADTVDNGTAYSYFHHHLDYNYYSNSQYTNPGNPVTTLPDSLYLTSKPAFFGAYDWPWVNPAGSNDAARIKTLPAKARFDAGTP